MRRMAKRRNRAAGKGPYVLALFVFVFIVGAGLYIAELGTDSLMCEGGEARLPQAASSIWRVVARGAAAIWRALLGLAGGFVRLLGLARCQAAWFWAT